MYINSFQNPACCGIQNKINIKNMDCDHHQSQQYPQILIVEYHSALFYN